MNKDRTVYSTRNTTFPETEYWKLRSDVPDHDSLNINSFDDVAAPPSVTMLMCFSTDQYMAVAFV